MRLQNNKLQGVLKSMEGYNTVFWHCVIEGCIDLGDGFGGRKKCQKVELLLGGLLINFRNINIISTMLNWIL